MTKARRAALRLVGGLQCGLGGLASAFAYLVYASPSTRDALAIASEEVPLYMFLFLVFGMFSILSGFLLVHEENSGS
jgi:hypothetical protein